MAVKINGSTGITFEDNDKENWGTGNDLEIYHDGSHSKIQSSTGALLIDSDNLQLRDKANTNIYLHGEAGGKVELRYNNLTKLETTASGIELTGGGITIPNGWNTQWGVNASRAFIQGEDANGNNRLILGTNNTERLRILSGGGLTFNGDTAAANALNDYEEGTWTPDPSDGSVTVTQAHYTKIGRLVQVWCYINNFSDSSTNDQIKISGLPFTPAEAGTIGTVMYSHSSDSTANNVYTTTTPQLYFYGNSNSTSSSYLQLRHNEITSDTHMYITGAYHV